MKKVLKLVLKLLVCPPIFLASAYFGHLGWITGDTSYTGICNILILLCGFIAAT